MNSQRRTFLKSAALGSAAFLTSSIPLNLYADPLLPIDDKGAFLLPKLPYDVDALEPVIDKQTLEIHHHRHHAGYVKGLNKAMAKLTEIRASGDYSLIKHWERELAFHGSGHVLHSLYWENLRHPKESNQPSVAFQKILGNMFGNYQAFEAQLFHATKAVEASGWGALVFEPHSKSMQIHQIEKHQNLTMWGVQPLLVIDVWEHAYYLNYQNNRGAYIKELFKALNWEVIEARYDAARQMK